MRKRFAVALTVLALLVSLPSRAQNAGDKDSQFGDKREDVRQSKPVAVLMQEGKTIVGTYKRGGVNKRGELNLHRFLEDGAEDTNFGSNGVATVVPWIGSNVSIYFDGEGICVGKIKISGLNVERNGVGCFDKDGKSFVANSSATPYHLIDVGEDRITLLKEILDGEVEIIKSDVAGDHLYILLKAKNFPYLARFSMEPNGRTLDSSFGNNGIIPVDSGAIGFGIQPDGSVVVVGSESIKAEKSLVTPAGSLLKDGKVAKTTGGSDSLARNQLLHLESSINRDAATKLLESGTVTTTSYNIILSRYVGKGMVLAPPEGGGDSTTTTETPASSAEENSGGLTVQSQGAAAEQPVANAPAGEAAAQVGGGGCSLILGNLDRL